MAIEPIAFDESGRDPNGFKCCPTCGYPHKGDACDNPACDANPAIPEEHKARRREAAAARSAQEAQWAKDRDLRNRAHAATIRDPHGLRDGSSAASGALTVAAIAASVKARQTRFLESRGLTWEEARALPQSEKDQLNLDWKAWDIADAASGRPIVSTFS